MVVARRYYAITKPLEYGVKRTPRRMVGCVSLVWLMAACISLPPLLILGNEHDPPDGKGPPQCTVCQNFGYQVSRFCRCLRVLLFVCFPYLLH